MNKEYWHQVTEINPENIPKGIKIGNGIGMESKHNGKVLLFDFDKGKETWRIKVRYLGVLDKDLPSKIKIQRIKEMKGYDANQKNCGGKE